MASKLLDDRLNPKSGFRYVDTLHPQVYGLRMQRLFVLAVFLTAIPLLMPQTSFAKPQQVDAATAAQGPDIVRFIECRATAQEYNAFAFEFADNEKTARKWGWKKVRKGNGMLSVYALSKPISVYGERTSRIAFSGTGIVALLPDRASTLVQRLELTPLHEGADAKLYGKTIASSKETVGDQVIKSQTQISVSTSAAYPDATLVGCSYSVTVE